MCSIKLININFKVSFMVEYIIESDIKSLIWNSIFFVEERLSIEIFEALCINYMRN
jgi:hypothetical protein